MSETQITCNRCNQTFLEWKFDEFNNKNRLWDISKRNWHDCKPKPKFVPPTVIPPEKIMWYCWTCGDVDINNHPCLHYQKLDPTTRAMIRLKPGRKI